MRIDTIWWQSFPKLVLQKVRKPHALKWFSFRALPRAGGLGSFRSEPWVSSSTVCPWSRGEMKWSGPLARKHRVRTRSEQKAQGTWSQRWIWGPSNESPLADTYSPDPLTLLEDESDEPMIAPHSPEVSTSNPESWWIYYPVWLKGLCRCDYIQDLQMREIILDNPGEPSAV